eukprot:6293382-Prymnesium_polylepis.1
MRYGLGPHPCRRRERAAPTPARRDEGTVRSTSPDMQCDIHSTVVLARDGNKQHNKHHKHSLRCLIETHMPDIRSRDSLQADSRAPALHAIGRAHADTAAELAGASSGWASAASGSAQLLLFCGFSSSSTTSSNSRAVAA